MVPAAFFWLRKAHDVGCNDGRKMLKDWESRGQSFCANCYKEAGNEKFKQCSKARPSGIAARNARLRRGKQVTRRIANAPQY